ncbi:MAG TPA: NAD(P)-binding domain-containing protein, partial [Hydrogenophaga sp.]|uniref:NAD(P)-binding domain-containing protein n=1 Tax=Hydrogenophaga sp. TaxID=1904254 RepID=UPI002BA6B063
MTQAVPARTLVLGAGAWGTALAISAARQGATRVRLWARDPAQAIAIDRECENRRYLPGLALPEDLSVVSGEAAPWVADADLVVVATPMAALRGWLSELRGLAVPVAWLCKGFERAASPDEPGLMGHEIAAAVAPGLRAGVLSGPSFAQEVARG